MDRPGERVGRRRIGDRGDRGRPPRIEAYVHGPETVIFDGENPLAWIASASAVPIARQA